MQGVPTMSSRAHIIAMTERVLSVILCVVDAFWGIFNGISITCYALNCAKKIPRILQLEDEGDHHNGQIRTINTQVGARAQRKHLGNMTDHSLTDEKREAEPNITHTGIETITLKQETEKHTQKLSTLTKYQGWERGTRERDMQTLWLDTETMANSCELDTVIKKINTHD